MFCGLPNSNCATKDLMLEDVKGDQLGGEGVGGVGGGTPVAAAPRLVVLGSLGGGMVVGGHRAASNSSCVAKDLMLWGWGRRSHQQLLCSKTADA